MGPPIGGWQKWPTKRPSQVESGKEAVTGGGRWGSGLIGVFYSAAAQQRRAQSAERRP
jgi:hypothetical protein